MVNNLNKEREQQFIEFTEKFNESGNSIAQRINEETKLKLEMMENEYNERKDQVIEQLLNSVLNDINPRLHQNLNLRISNDELIDA